VFLQVGDYKYRPYPKQFLGHTCGADEIFFGGSKGGSKTFWGIFHTAYHAALYGKDANTVIFRRIYDDLMNIIREFKRYFDKPGIGHYKPTDHVFEWESGAVTSLRHLEREDDAEGHQGRQYTLIYFDELTHFTEKMYMTLYKELRAPYPGVKPQMISGGNPGGIGHRWVNDRFVEDKEPYVRYQYTMPAQTVGGVLVPEQVVERIFIRSHITDNTELLKNDPGYLGRLADSLSPRDYEALVGGDWKIFAGLAFPEWREELHVVDDFPIPKDWKVIRCMDWGYSSPFWYGVVAQNPKTRAIYLIDEHYGCKVGERGGRSGVEMSIEEVRRLIIDSEAENAAIGNYPRPWYGVADPSMWARTGGENSIGNRVNAGGHLFRRANRQRPYRKQVYHSLLRTDPGTGKPGVMVFGSCHEVRRSIPKLVLDKDVGIEDVDTDQEDHAYDGWGYGLVELVERPGRANRDLDAGYLEEMKAPPVMAMF